MKEETSIVCIMCPLGCRVLVNMEGGEVSSIQGYACVNGKEYAEEEILSPARTIMSVVKCTKGDFPTVSVKTSGSIPKEKIYSVRKSIADVEVEAPVEVGEKVIEDVCGLDIDVVSTRRVKRVQDR